MTARKTAAVVIPARLDSRRFPRKVLARETGKYLVQHVFEAVVGCPAVSRVILATDSQEVADAARSFGAEARMTSAEHVSGTDRVAEVARTLDEEFIINVQGDEPLITALEVARLVDLFEWDGAGTVEMTTLAVRRHDAEGYTDPNVVKAVLGKGNRALYFSRAPIPYERTDDGSAAVPRDWWHHLGVYGYRRTFLLRFAELDPTPLEKRERLEQLRAIENGYVLRVGEATGRHIGVDTPEDYQRFVAWFNGLGGSAAGTPPRAR
jgi:3-deoxy-manno-octulosonate cytidylyltransferase (CMP-KDO synthetase)